MHNRSREATTEAEEQQEEATNQVLRECKSKNSKHMTRKSEGWVRR